MHYSTMPLTVFLIAATAFFNSAIYSQSNPDNLVRNIEFAIELGLYIRNYTDKVGEMSDQAETFQQLLEDVVAKRPSDILVSKVAKPIGEILRDFKREAQGIRVPEYAAFVPTVILLGPEVYANRNMIRDEVDRVMMLNRYYQKLLDLKAALEDLNSRYRQMKEGIHDVQEMFRNYGKVLVGLQYDWVAFETNYPGTLGDAHIIIEEKLRDYARLEGKTKGDLRTAAILVLYKLQEEKERNSSKQKEVDEIKKLNEEVQALKKELDGIKKQMNENDNFIAVCNQQIENANASIRFNTGRIREARERRATISAPGYLESSYNLCPGLNSWDLCTNPEHVKFKEQHRAAINNEISNLRSSILNYTRFINESEQTISQQQTKKNQYSQLATNFRNQYAQKEPPYIKKDNEYKEKSRQFLNTVLNNVVQFFLQDNQSETSRINGVLLSLN